MTFGQSIKTCFTKYADFHGRATRAEYWWFVLFVGSVGFGAGFIDCRLLDQCDDWGGALGWLWQIATLLPALAVGARRLHDIGRSGWWLLLVLTIVGIIPLVVMACFPSQQKANEYGEPSVAKPMPVPQPMPESEPADFLPERLELMPVSEHVSEPVPRAASSFDETITPDKPTPTVKPAPVAATSKPAGESVKKSGPPPVAWVMVGGAIGLILITMLIGSESNKETPTARQTTQTAGINQPPPPTARQTTQTADINQYVNGKKHGHWVEEYTDNSDPSAPHEHRAEGSYVDGKRQGHWVEHHTDGSAVGEGPYVDGKKHGHWVERYVDGAVQGPYVDGELHGHWVLRWADGQVEEGPVVDGKRHGHWVERYVDGAVHEGPYVDGKRHGHWVVRHADGEVQEGPYVDGKKHGHWVLRFADGTVDEGPFVGDKKHGHWVERFASGQVEEGPYVDGKRHGKWVYWYPTGLLEYRTFRNGEEVK
ncbi:MAG: DUF805 domain-containing protein [Gammaproteobacteria bacterium]|nr:DUF805 domain-containing protein [Gammaproteobacteria bacterium]